MANQKSFIKIKGTLGGLTFYKSRDGHLIREKGGIDAKRMKTDPAFRRTRENGAEFGAACKAGKTMRLGLRSLLRQASDGRVGSRIVSNMMRIKNLDATSHRGKRTVTLGFQSPEAKAIFLNFNFNVRSSLDSVLGASYFVDPITHEIHFPELTPMLDVHIPEGASHFSLQGAVSLLDFETGETRIAVSPEEIYEVDDNTTASLDLIPAGVPSGSGTQMDLLLLQFYQEVNGVKYPLRNGVYNALTVVGMG